MINAHIKERSAVPWWAAFGAPLLGVPLLIGLLAVGSANTSSEQPIETESSLVKEPVEATAIQSAVELPPLSMEIGAAPRC